MPGIIGLSRVPKPRLSISRRNSPPLAFEEAQVGGFMKKGKRGLGHGLRFQDLHPGIIHDPVPDAKVVGLGRPLWLERMIRTKVKTAHLIRIDENGPCFTNVLFFKGLSWSPDQGIYGNPFK